MLRFQLGFPRDFLPQTVLVFVFIILLRALVTREGLLTFINFHRFGIPSSVLVVLRAAGSVDYEG